MEKGEQGRAGPQALRRGLILLSALKDAAPLGINVTDLARMTGIERPTVHRLLLSLEAHGWVRKGEENSKRYFVGMQSNWGFAQTAIQNDEHRKLVLQAMGSMRRLADQLGDAVFLVVRDGNESLTIHREIGDYPVQILASYPGKRHPLGVGSSGMALLASLPEHVARKTVESNSMRLEEYGMTPEVMHRLRKNTQLRGYSVMQNYAVRGAMGIGCALTTTNAEPLLALSVSAITERMTLKRQQEIAKLLQQELGSLRA